jgi:predicted anti-sigma-YlaC factor YlaD
MNCKEIHKNLNAYLDDHLDTKSRGEFDLHMKECASCNQVVSEVKATLTLLGSSKELEPDPFMHTRIIAELERENEMPWSVQKILQPIMLSVLILTGVYLGVGLGNRFYNEDGFNQRDSEMEFQVSDLEISFDEFNDEMMQFLITE